MQSQRRRLIIMKEMAKVMEDFDMYITLGGDTGLTNQTGHPAAVFPYNFASRNPTGTPPSPPQPITITIIGNLFADDKILSVAHAYQNATDWHTRHPTL
jgi:Asp-tRNA(Asn)/Glu-tRNA(Gln) amidotransferase A subunit family amidase